jgi:hypothetical protein
MSNDERRFYVYAFLRSKDSEHGKKFTPYYIGKGSGRRWVDRTGRIIPAPSSKDYIAFVAENLTEQEAFAMEEYCIRLYGRIDLGTGILRNLTNGGEGTTGWVMPREQAERMSQILKGRTLSQETRQRMAEAQRGRTHSPDTIEKMSRRAAGAGNAFHGRKHSEESRMKMSKTRTGHPVSDETRRKMSESRQGFRHTDESKAKLSIARQKYEYEVTMPTGETITTRNLSQFAKEHSIASWALYKSAQNQGQVFKGFSVVIKQELK